MAYPASYTETTLAQYMHGIITHDDAVNELTSTLRWKVETGTYDEAVSEVMAVYGTDDITAVTGRANLRKLRAAARVELWGLVMQRTVPSYQVSDGQLTTSRNQIHEHAKAMYEMFRAQAIEIYGLTSYSNIRPVRGGHVAIKVSVV